MRVTVANRIALFRCRSILRKQHCSDDHLTGAVRTGHGIPASTRPGSLSCMILVTLPIIDHHRYAIHFHHYTDHVPVWQPSSTFHLPQARFYFLSEPDSTSFWPHPKPLRLESSTKRIAVRKQLGCIQPFSAMAPCIAARNKRIVMLLCCSFQCEQLLANGPLLKMLPDEYGNVGYLSLRINFHVIRFLVGILEPEPARRIAER